MAHVREYIVKEFGDCVSDDVMDYTAGLFDADGHIHSSTQVSICQSERGIKALHFVYEHFGGKIVVQVKANELHQAAYNWILNGQPCMQFAHILKDRLILKKREMILLLEYFDAPIRSKSKIMKRIKELRHSPHDPIPEDVMPSNAYFAGFSDGEITLDANGKSYQHHNITQKYRPILDLFQKRWGGRVNVSKKSETRNESYYWDIYTFADKFLTSIAPYIVGKREQVELIINMKPGEGQLVHAKLHDMKGNVTVPTPKIDRINRGEGRVYKLPPKTLPRGVHLIESSGKYRAMLRYEKQQYTLGMFDTAESAKAKYDEVCEAVLRWKCGGPPVDLAAYTKPVKDQSKPKPPPPGTILPKGVYLTAANTYQARYHINAFDKKIHQLGTYRTIEEAVNARRAFEEKLRRECIAIPTTP